MNRKASDRGGLIVIAAPSGAGKTTLVHELLKRMPDLAFSISHTTREPRPKEKHGVDYFFVDTNEFERMARSGAFLEHAEVFDHWYGTGKAGVESLRAAGRTVLLEIDWQGARQVRREAPDAKLIFIVPPSLHELEARLRGRRTDSDATIERRLRDSVGDLSHWHEFDYVIVNDDLAGSAEALARVVGGGGEDCRSDSPAIRRRVESMLAAGQDTGSRLQ
ncbi:MAG TPA: guanylate kinase [Gammaproteobacteria bacterium]|nr:guanylate kinase [Gammaproteobacteria bacterium]